MNRDDLRMIWLCHECRLSFFFNSDVIDHRRASRHSRISKYDLHSGKLMNRYFD